MTRKLMLIATMFVAMLVGSTSCSNDSKRIDEPQTTVAEDRENLIADLEAFNASWPKFDTTRGDKDGGDKKSKQELSRAEMMQIVNADANSAAGGAEKGALFGTWMGLKGVLVGICVGGVIYGAEGSIAEYRKIVLQKTQKKSAPLYDGENKVEFNTIVSGYVLSRDRIDDDDFKLGVVNEIDSCYVEVAIRHNIILESLKEIESLDKGSLIDGLTDDEKVIVRNPEFIDGFNDVSNDPFNFPTSMSGYALRILNLFTSGINSSCNSQDDVNRFVKYYNTSVRQTTSLTQNEKNYLHIAFAVTAYSYQYWAENINIVEGDDGAL